MPKAYSYIRFSTAKQLSGDSLRRQEKLATEYALKHSLELDNSSYRDLGMSAYRSQNASEGSLKLFLDAVDQRLIARGSYLLVESLDRLSRAEVPDALELLLGIIKRGIIVVTLLDTHEYSRQTIASDRGMSLIVSITMMARANEESATKSSRVRSAWEGKRQRGEILTAMSPAWLELASNRQSWIQIPDKVNAVCRIFDLSVQGHGSPSIARILNAEGVPTMQRAEHWTFGTVAAILKNEAVFGRYVPKKALADPVENYFPIIISESTFRQVQAGMRNRRWIGGRNSANITNLFAGSCFCYACQSPMRIVGTSAHHIYLRCLSAYSNSGCNEGRFPYRAAEKAILWKLADDVSYMMANRQTLDDPIPALESKRDDIKSRLEKLVAASEIAPDVSVLATRIARLSQELNETEKQIKISIRPSDLNIDRDDMNELFAYFRNELGDIPLEVRRRIQSFLRRIIHRIEFWCDQENNRPTLAVDFFPEYGANTLYIDVNPWREKVGGARRKGESLSRRN
jgi:DNA invertase Pin-like site-specific DNA recombinase